MKIYKESEVDISFYDQCCHLVIFITFLQFGDFLENLGDEKNDDYVIKKNQFGDFVLIIGDFFEPFFFLKNFLFKSIQSRHCV